MEKIMQKIFVIEDDENIRICENCAGGYGYQVLAFETAERL